MNGSMIRLNEAQLTALRDAPDGQRVKVQGQIYVKKGGQLFPAPAATPQPFPPAPPVPTVAPNTVKVKDVIPGGRAVSDFGQSVYGGMKKAVGAMPEIPGALLRAGKELVTDPKQFARDIPPFIESAIPMRETLTSVGRAVASGDPRQLPRMTTVGDEAGQLIASTALGKAVPALGKRAVRRGVAELPGAAVELHELAAPKIRALADDLRPAAGAAQQAYADLAAIGNPKLFMGNFRQAVSKLIADEYVKPVAEQDANWIRYLQTHLQDSEAGWNFDRVKAATESLGQQSRAFQSTAGARPGETIPSGGRIYTKQLAEMLGALDEDVRAGQPVVEGRYAPTVGEIGGQPSITSRPGEAAGDIGMERVAGRGGGSPTQQTLALHPAWQKARLLYRRDRAATGLARSIEDAIGTAGDAWTSVGGLNRLITRIQKARALAGKGNKAEGIWVRSFEPRELDKIIATLREMKRGLPAMTKGKGVITGTSQRFIRGSVGAAAGALFGHGSPAAWEMGSAAGVLLPEVMAKIMTSDAGRALVRRAMKIDPTVGPLFQRTLAGALRSQSSRADDTSP